MRIMNPNPLISVIITTYNRPRLLERAVNSVIQQSYKNFEVIIVDDFSTYDVNLPDDSRIIYLKNDKNKGVQYSRNKGLDLATGKFILNLDDDDYFHRNRIEILHKTFTQGTYSFVCSNYQYIHGNSVLPKINKVNIDTINLNDILFSNLVGPSIFTKTDYLKDVGGWDNQLNSAQDLDLWTRLIHCKGNALRISDNLLTVDQSKERSRISNNKSVVSGYYQVYLKHKNLMNHKHIKYNLIKFRRIRGLKTSLFNIIKFTPNYLMVNEVKRYFNF